MASSRLERLGTIFSRVTSLIRTGVLKRENKPIWYDVYQVFPPETEPSFAFRRPKSEIRDILYPEDTIRAKFHLKMQKRLPMEDLLQESTNDLTRRAIDMVDNMIKKDPSLSEDQAVDNVIEVFKQEGIVKAAPSSRSRRSEDERVETEFEEDIDDAGPHSFSKKFREGVKTISDRGIDVSKYMKDD